MGLNTYVGRYMTCDYPGCTVQTGGCCVDHDGDKGPPLAHWEPLADGRWFCPRHADEAVGPTT